MKSKVTSTVKLNSIASEAYKTLRTNIQYSSLDSQLKTIVITSTFPGEGKSTIAYNLAKSMAVSEKRILLMDCDFRRPTIHKLLRISNVKGLSDILIGEANSRDSICHTNVKNLYALTCGSIPPNPSELLSSNVFKKYLTELSSEFDTIIIDTPPVLAVTDAQILSNIADGTILVTAYGKTDKNDIVKAKKLLSNVKANIIGCVFNQVPNISTKSYYYN